MNWLIWLIYYHCSTVSMVLLPASTTSELDTSLNNISSEAKNAAILRTNFLSGETSEAPSFSSSIVLMLSQLPAIGLIVRINQNNKGKLNCPRGKHIRSNEDKAQEDLN